MDETAMNNAIVDKLKDSVDEVLRHTECCTQPYSDQKLYQVWNTANKKILVIASTKECAIYLSRCAGHVKADTNATAVEAPKEILNDNNAFAGSLRRAVRAGEAGCISRVGDFATIPSKGLVFMPISGVD